MLYCISVKFRPPRYEGGCHDILYDAKASLSSFCSTLKAFKTSALGKVLHPTETLLQ